MTNIEIDLLKVLQYIGNHKKDNIRPKKQTIRSFMNMNPNSPNYSIYLKYSDIASKKYNLGFKEIENYLNELCSKKFIRMDYNDYYYLTDLGLQYLKSLDDNSKKKEAIYVSTGDDFEDDVTENLIALHTSLDEVKSTTHLSKNESIKQRNKENHSANASRIRKTEKELLKSDEKLIDVLKGQIDAAEEIIKTQDKQIKILEDAEEKHEKIIDNLQKNNENLKTDLKSSLALFEEFKTKYEELKNKLNEMNNTQFRLEYYNKYIYLKKEYETLNKNYNELKKTMTLIDKNGEYFGKILDNNRQLKEENRDLKSKNEKLIKGDIWLEPELLQRISMDYYRKFKEVKEKYEKVELFSPKQFELRIQNLNKKNDDYNKQISSLKADNSEMKSKLSFYKSLLISNDIDESNVITERFGNVPAEIETYQVLINNYNKLVFKYQIVGKLSEKEKELFSKIENDLTPYIKIDRELEKYSELLQQKELKKAIVEDLIFANVSKEYFYYGIYKCCKMSNLNFHDNCHELFKLVEKNKRSIEN